MSFFSQGRRSKPQDDHQRILDHAADYSDQVNIFDPEQWAWPVHLIGLGGINNLVGPILVKMGIRNIHLWDDDRLEGRNLPTEVGYSSKMLGQPKVAAAADAIYYLMDACPGLELHQHQQRVDEHTKLSGIVISGVDSMASRRVIWQAVENCLVDIPLYIDGRSGGEITSIFAFSPLDYDDVNIYKEHWLFGDDETLPLACGARNIGYISAYMASEIARIITRFARTLPVEFFTYRDFQ